MGSASGVIFGPNGNLFGTTSNGGTNDDGGIVFELTPPVSGQTKWTEQVLANIRGGMPAGLLKLHDGSLVGLSYGGGAKNNGNVFLLKPPAQGKTLWNYSDIYDFQGGNDGANPATSLIAGSNGVLYGTTNAGGSANVGTVFSLKPPSKGHVEWTENVLYAFQGGVDGETPKASLALGKGGVLFGTTSLGGTCPGVTAGCGTVFSVTPPTGGTGAWTEAVLLAFNITNGYEPLASLVVKPNGALLGAVPGGGQSDGGLIFELAPPKDGGTEWTYSSLYQCVAGDGGNGPEGALLFSGMTYFGTAKYGGRAGAGVVFNLTPP